MQSEEQAEQGGYGQPAAILGTAGGTDDDTHQRQTPRDLHQRSSSPDRTAGLCAHCHFSTRARTTKSRTSRASLFSAVMAVSS